MTAAYPAPETIRAARHRARLTQREAAALVSVTQRAWAHWEHGTRRMRAAYFELFLAKTGQRR